MSFYRAAKYAHRGALSLSTTFSLLFISVLLLVLPARGDVIDTSFDAHLDTTTFFNKRISKIVVQPDGKMVAWGSFNKYNGRSVGSMIRVNPDGSLDNSFDTDLFQTMEDGSNDLPKLLPDGKIIVSGSFTLNDGTAYFYRPIRVNTDGTLDASFSLEPTGSVWFTDVDASGRVLVLGNLQYVRDGQTVTRGLVRLNVDGTVDDSFNATVGMDRFITQGNKIVYIRTENSTYLMRRLNEDGSPDNSFVQTSLGGFSYSSLEEQSDHRIVLIHRDTNVIRINVDGGIDNTFQSPTFSSGSTTQMRLLSDDRMIVMLAPTTPPFGARFIRLLPNGEADPSFTSYLYTPYGSPAWAAHSDGSIMIGDAGLNFSANTFVKLLPGGQVDTAYNQGEAGFQNIRPGKIRAIRVLASNKILIGGDFDLVNSVSRNKIALLNHNSTLDPSFQINTTPTGNYFSRLDDIYDIELQSDGKLLISGSFTYVVGGISKSNVVRLNQNGSIDPTFVLGPQINDHYVTSLLSTNKPVPRLDGKIVIANSKTGPGESHPPIVLLPGGARDTSFSPTVFGTNSVIVFDVAVLSSGKILIVGQRSYLDGGTNSVIKGFVARLNADGTTDTTFQVFEMLNKKFVASRVLPDGKILAIHRSDNSSRVYRVNADGTPDDTFDDGAGANGRLNALAVLLDGRIVVGGSFTSYNGDPRKNLAVLSADGNLLSRHIDVNKEVLCLSLDNNGRVLVGGFFTSLQGEGQQVQISYLARLNEFTPTSQSPFDFDGDGKTDVGIFRLSVGEWWYQRSSDGQVPAFQFGNSTDKIVPADFTGDGKTDVAIWRPSVGEWFVLRSENGSFYSFPFGASGDIPIPADYDNDGKADAAVFRPSTATWYIQRSTGGTTIEQFGANGDVPVPADYDGDGRADLAIFRPSNGQWWLNRSTAGVIALTFGGGTDKAVQGDYTGDGKADVAFWRPSTGEWFVLRSEDFSYYSAPFGASTDIPAAGDYDGDGKIDATVFRPSTATWFSQRSSGGTVIQQFGATGDTPIPSGFAP